MPTAKTITSFPGEIKVPQKVDLEYYDHNLVAVWNIFGENGKVIVFKLLYLDIELGQGSCLFDVLIVSL